MTKVTGKRIGAYFIDVIIVSIIISLFTSISYLNPNTSKIKEYNDKMDEKVKEILKADNMDYEAVYNELEEDKYQIDFLSVHSSVIELVVLFLYFSIFQFYNNGQTIGKKLLHIQVVANNKEKLRLSHTIIRSAFLNSILILSLSIIAVLYLNKGIYVKTSTILDIIDFGITIACIIMVLKREDGMGLHDVLAGTRVLACEDVDTFMKDNVKEAKVSEKKSTKKEKK